MATPTSLVDLPSPLLILGGAHAGKSALAHQGLRHGEPAVVIGTGAPGESVHAERLAELYPMRPEHWQLVERPSDLAAELAAHEDAPQVLIDSVSQWLAATVLSELEKSPDQVEERLAERAAELVRVIREHPGRIVLVSAEAGSSPAPARVAERLYRKRLGLLNQEMAKVAASVVFVTAGIPQVIKRS